VVALALGYNFFKDKTPKTDVVVVERGDVVEEVSVTGKVKPISSVDLAFEQAGRISNIDVGVGDVVFAGQHLASLSGGDILALLRQAEATVMSQEAKLAELKAGTRVEELAVQEVKVANAKVALNDARNNVIDKIKDAYSKSDDAVRNRIDQFMSNPRGDNPQLEFNIGSKVKIESDRVLVEDVLEKWQSDISLLSSLSDLSLYISDASRNLSIVHDYVSLVSLAVNSLKASASITQTTIDGWRSDLSTARTNVNTAVINLSTAEEKLNTAGASLSLSEQELALQKAGSTKEQIQAGEASVVEAKANVSRYQAELAKTLIRSPINGIVVKMNADVGEIVSSNDIIISVISAGNFEIEAFVPEADIAKIEIGDYAKITLDAYGSDVLFEANVVSVEPAETVIEGVSTYKTVLQFTQKDQRVRSGMTANIDILTNKKENVIYVPRKAILEDENGRQFVRIKKNGGSDTDFYKEVNVVTGLIGSDGNAEILGGLEEGDTVITYIEE